MHQCHLQQLLSSGSHILTLRCSLQSRWFQQKFHPKSRPAHTSHGRWWTALTHYGRWAQQHPSAVAPACTHTAMAHTPAALSSPLFPPQPRPQTQALTRQHDAATTTPPAAILHRNVGWKLPQAPWCSLLPSWPYKSWRLTELWGPLIQKSKGNSSKEHSKPPN